MDLGVSLWLVPVPGMHREEVPPMIMLEVATVIKRVVIRAICYVGKVRPKVQDEVYFVPYKSTHSECGLEPQKCTPTFRTGP
jgi:hypothetical protein